MEAFGSQFLFYNHHDYRELSAGVLAAQVIGLGGCQRFWYYQLAAGDATLALCGTRGHVFGFDRGLHSTLGRAQGKTPLDGPFGTSFRP